MSFWRKLRRSLSPEHGRGRFHFELPAPLNLTPDRFGGEGLRLELDFSPELARTIEALAVEDRSTPEEVALDLLIYGLDKRLETESFQSRWKSLTPREREVTALTCLGMTNPQIANHLGISLETARDHVRNALGKFDLQRKSELRGALREWDFSLWLDE